MTPLTLIEFIAEQEGNDIEWAKKFIEEIMKAVIKEPNHYGDCTKENVTCNLCCLEGILNDYYEYFKKQTGPSINFILTIPESLKL